MKSGLIGILLTVLLCGCAKREQKPYSLWMAESEMQRWPELWQVDYVKKPKWDYTQGLMAQSLLKVAGVFQDQRIYDYVKTYADQFIDTAGNIMAYKKEQYSLDRVNGGKFLWMLWHKTKDPKYYQAIIGLYQQIKEQPRTTEGGFWHKLIYPSQMWLDGLYMGAPFYAQCGVELGEDSVFNDVIDQFMISYRHTYDARTGLNFHAWDESREQEWANKETGCSAHVWGRAMGWYFMALTDVLDYIPETHPRRPELLDLLRRVAEGVKNAQHDQYGVWYQVMDEPARNGNYLEATASSMFVYSFYKCVRMGYLPADPYRSVAQRGYDGILKQFLREGKDGTISLTQCCAVAGLGGDPYRSGSFDYYIHEQIRDNDPKGVGPFILASLEREQMETSAKE